MTDKKPYNNKIYLMEVYIEYVIIDNLIIDLIILFITAKILKLKIKKRIIFLSAIIGTAFAVVMPLISINFYLLTLLKLIVGFLMIIILKSYANFLEMTATFLVLIMVTFMLGGVCYSILSLSGGVVHPQNLIIFGFESPISIFLLIICFFVFLFLKILNFIQHKTAITTYIYKIKISINNKEFELNALLDTANELFDENNRPVIVLSQNYYKKIVNSTNLKPTEYLQVHSVTTLANLIAFEVDSLEIMDKNIKKMPAKFAVSQVSFENYDCLLNKAIFY